MSTSPFRNIDNIKNKLLSTNSQLPINSSNERATPAAQLPPESSRAINPSLLGKSSEDRSIVNPSLPILSAEPKCAGACRPGDAQWRKRASAAARISLTQPGVRRDRFPGFSPAHELKRRDRSSASGPAAAARAKTSVLSRH